MKTISAVVNTLHISPEGSILALSINDPDAAMLSIALADSFREDTVSGVVGDDRLTITAYRDGERHSVVQAEISPAEAAVIGEECFIDPACSMLLVHKVKGQPGKRMLIFASKKMDLRAILPEI